MKEPDILDDDSSDPEGADLSTGATMVLKWLLERLNKFLLDNISWEVKLDPTCTLMVVSSIDTTEPMPVLYNLLCLITKKCIHSSKCKGNIPNKKGLIQNFLYVRNIEHSIAPKRHANAIKADVRKRLGVAKLE